MTGEAKVPQSARESWGIVGGGLLGMTLALRLAQAGREVTLLEASDRLGGLASPWRLGDVVWDRHYHVTLKSDVHLLSLLAELGLEERLRWAETRTGFYVNSKMYSLSNTLEFLRFPPLGLLDKLRLALTIVYASRIRDWRRLEKVSVEDWLCNWSGRRTFERIWQPLLRAKLGENYRRTSAAYIWAVISRMYAARRTRLKKEVFGYVPGGYATILGRFTETLVEGGVAIRRNCAVRTVGRDDYNGRIVIEAEHGEQLSFNSVVLTVPAPVAAHLCPELSDDERAWLNGIEYQGIVCASLLLQRPLADFYITNIIEPDVPFTAVIEMTALVDRSQFGGRSLVYLPKYLFRDDPFFSVSDQQVEESFLDALEEMYPRFDRSDVLCFRISRAPFVHPLPTLRYSERLPPMRTSVPGLHLINSAHILNGTLNVNETIRLAEASAMELLATCGRVTTNSSVVQAR